MIALLESLIVDNDDLERLEALLDQFNIFEALGAVWVELRHSDFLSFLLNPNQNHGLGDTFAKRLLQRVLANAPGQFPIRPIDLDVADLSNMLVLREWQNVDILLLDEDNNLAVIIENKIGGGEHSDQLTRYRRALEQHYPGLKHICLYLTPEGEEPSDPEYIQLDYAVIAEIVEGLVESRASTLGGDIHTLMIHYVQMLRRHIVSESEIAELCRKIYRKHQRALDLIYEYRPDQQAAIREILVTLIQSEEALVKDYCVKTYIRFYPKDWDTPVLLQGEGWTSSGQILLFEFGNFPNRLRLSLIIGPGLLELRQRLFAMAQDTRPLKPAYRGLGKRFNTIYTRDFLKARSYENASIDELEAEIKAKWEQFLKNDLPTIRDILREQSWIWET